MDSLDRLLAALDGCRRHPAREPSGLQTFRTPVPSTFVAKAQAKAEEAKAELREALRGAVVEALCEDFKANGITRQVLYGTAADDEGAAIVRIPHGREG